MKKNVLPDYRQRQDDAAAAKRAMLGRFRAAPGPDDPAVAERRRAREAMLAERAARVAQRKPPSLRMKPNWPSRPASQQNSPRRLSGRPQKRGRGKKPSGPSARPLSWPNKKPPAMSATGRGRRRKSNDGRAIRDKIRQANRSMLSQLPDSIVCRIIEQQTVVY